MGTCAEPVAVPRALGCTVPGLYATGFQQQATKMFMEPSGCYGEFGRDGTGCVGCSAAETNARRLSVLDMFLQDFRTGCSNSCVITCWKICFFETTETFQCLEPGEITVKRGCYPSSPAWGKSTSVWPAACYWLSITAGRTAPILL